MKTKLLLIGTVLVFLSLFFIIPNKYSSMLPVFQLTEEPTVVSKGSHGKTITIDLTFGKEDIETFIKSLQAPYPHFFISIDWIKRSPSLIKIMKEKSIPISLLGQDGLKYIEDPNLFKKEIDEFEQSVGELPLWFRTKDYEFPMELQKTAWENEVNLLSSSKYWMEGDPFPKLEKGDILSVPLHQEERIDIKQLNQLLKSDSLLSVEQNIFGLTTKSKTIPD
ncbi:hypothetical protein AM499_17210 [Bacillus sp. FJAT-22090]|uniref:hypothetical protein n=1 Tax=Bacillus sp. FJAT-22090 TaxID=1581038 RepID=UPI0006AF25BF|nr:hypothetical protein [Bacillus sp. FJAT-22090]ALC87364.1 hypothetical protein AM499_17210 [Bacillus sp. FJAT-22090]